MKEIYGKHGAKIAIMGRRENVLKDSVEKLKEMNIDAIYVQGYFHFIFFNQKCKGDVRNHKSCEEAAKKTFDHFGSLDTLINGAAGNFLALAEGKGSHYFFIT